MKKICSYVIVFCIGISHVVCSKAGGLLKFVEKMAVKSESVMLKEAHIGKYVSPNEIHFPCKITSSDKQFIATRSTIIGGKIIRKNLDNDNNKR